MVNTEQIGPDPQAVSNDPLYKQQEEVRKERKQTNKQTNRRGSSVPTVSDALSSGQTMSVMMESFIRTKCFYILTEEP